MLQVKQISSIWFPDEIRTLDDELAIEFDEQLDEGLMRSRQHREARTVRQEHARRKHDAFERFRHPSQQRGLVGQLSSDHLKRIKRIQIEEGNEERADDEKREK